MLQAQFEFELIVYIVHFWLERAVEVRAIHNECIIVLREELVHLWIVEETAGIVEIELKDSAIYGPRMNLYIYCKVVHQPGQIQAMYWRIGHKLTTIGHNIAITF